MSTNEELEAQIEELRQQIYQLMHGRLGARGIKLGDKRFFADATHFYMEDIDGAVTQLDGGATPGGHKGSHENTGGDEVDVGGLSGLLADDQHVLDAEAISAVEGEATLALTGVLTVTADTDSATTLGRAVVGDIGDADRAGFAHVDQASATNYALKQNPSGATAVNAATGQAIYFNINNSTMATLDSSGNLIMADGKLAEVDTINEATAAAGVTIDDTLIKDNRIYPDAGTADVQLFAHDATGDLFLYGDYTDNDTLYFDESEDTWQFVIGGDPKFQADATGAKVDVIGELTAAAGVTGDGVLLKDGSVVIADAGYLGSASDTDAIQIEADGDVVLTQDLAVTGTTISTGAMTATAGLTSGANVVSDTDDTDDLGTTSVRWANLHLAHDVKLDSTPDADHEVSGITAVFTANENQAIGDVCYINADGEMQLGDADAIASSKIVGMCADATISADASGDYLMLGFVRDDTWTWTVGGAVYLTVTGTTGNTLSQTAPSGTDDCVVIVGIATHADRLWYNPTVQAIVEHT